MKALQQFADKILLNRSQVGDTNAFGVLYKRYVGKIYRFVYFRIREKEMVDDLTNDIFLKVWQQIQANKKVDNFKAYIYKTARNLIIDHYRRRREQVDIEKVPHLIDEDYDLFSEVTLNNDVTDLMKKIETLRDDYKEVLLLRYVEDFSIAEIADILDKSVGAVKVLTHRAINKLKDKYD